MDESKKDEDDASFTAKVIMFPASGGVKIIDEADLDKLFGTKPPPKTWLELETFEDMTFPESQTGLERLTDSLKSLLYKSLGRPVSSILFKLGFEVAGAWIHEVTVPNDLKVAGRYRR